MAKIQVYVEVVQRRAVPEAMGMFEALSSAPLDAAREAEKVIHALAGFGLEVASDSPPVPLYAEDVIRPASGFGGFESFSAAAVSPDVAAESLVVLCEVNADKVEELESRDNIRVFGFVPPELFGACGCGGSGPFARSGFDGFGGFGATEGPRAPAEEVHPFDLARTAGGVDCRPFLPGVSLAVIRQLLAVDRPWNDGFTGQNVVAGIIDAGVNSLYPVIGGFGRPNTFRPGAAPITTHGSMCAADVLVAAPSARLLDYPIFDRSGNGIDALPAWQAVLNQRRLNGTPHVTNNSYGFYTIPPLNLRTPATDKNHPLNRKIREVVAAGVACFFAAGNCGNPCPTGPCNNNTTTAVPINGSNSLPEVITVAAVNSRRSRIGYSSQGPGNFAPCKPDLSGYSHFFGNFGPGRPGGTGEPFDSGTSAATPVVCGVAALLLSAFPTLTPPQMAGVLTQTAIDLGQPGFDTDTGFGVVNAGAAYSRLRTGPVPAGLTPCPPAPGGPAPAGTDDESDDTPAAGRKKKATRRG